MADPTTPYSLPWVLKFYAKNALINNLNLDKTAVHVASADAWDSDWQNLITVLVIGGESFAEGDGQGGQIGECLFRRMILKFVVYYRCHLDQYSLTEIALGAANDGLDAFFESVRQLFRYTMFGNQSGSQCLLTEPMKWVGESAAAWIDKEAGVLRKDLTYSAIMAEDLPNGITLFMSQCQPT